MTRRELMASGFALVLPQSRQYTFHILGLLKPRKLIIWPQPMGRLFVQMSRGSVSLEGVQSCTVSVADTPIAVTSPNGQQCGMMLEVPGVLRRRYQGTLNIGSSGELLVPVLTMDREAAVSSITGAEMPVSGAPQHALTAQAVVARSFLTAAAPRHMGYDFCDTTHCQFLRSPAVEGSPVDRGVRRTSGLTLETQGSVIPCRYSAACGGHTDERDELGYRYQSVECEGCRVNHYARRGHGLGLCQEGTIHLARKGWTYEQILALYLPASRLG
ncbi:MAG: SpoIID/LytB domain-containing protein [Bryobacteraceae bacterium]